MDDKIAFASAQLVCACFYPLQTFPVGVVVPALDHTGDADQPHARRHDAVKIIRDHLKDRGTEITYSRAPAEHGPASTPARMSFRDGAAEFR